MSDYLTRVVERTVGRAAGVRPLLAPLFAPGTGSAAAGPGGEPGGWIDEGPAPFPAGPAALTADRVAGRSNPAHRPVAGIEEREAARPAPPSLPSAVQRPAKGVTDSPEAPEPLASATGNGRRNGHAATSPVASQRSGSIAPGVLEPSGSDLEESSLAGSDIFQQASRFVQRRTERQNSGLLVAGEEGSPRPAGEGTAAAETGRMASSPARSDGMLPRRAPHRDRPLPRVAEEAGSTQAGEAAPPAIRISIGRIDVRAIVPQPAPVKAAPPPAPKVSLDDYLRKQPGGAR